MHINDVCIKMIKTNLSEIKSLSQSDDFCNEDVLKCIMGISDLDTRVFCELVEKGMAEDIDEISKKVRRDRSSVQRSLKNLIAVGLVSRKSQCAGRGRRYIYSSITNGNLKDVLISRIDTYCSILKEKVEKME